MSRLLRTAGPEGESGRRRAGDAGLLRSQGGPVFWHQIRQYRLGNKPVYHSIHVLFLQNAFIEKARTLPSTTRNPLNNNGSVDNLL